VIRTTDRDDEVGREAGAPRGRRTRRDYLASRRDLLDAADRLLARHGRRFSLVELAAEANVSTATAYRHFADVHEALDVYYFHIVDQLVTEIAAVPVSADRIRHFEQVCDLWVRSAARWGRAAVHVRSSAGFLARRRAGNELVCKLYDTLAPVLAGLVDAGVLDSLDPEYAVMLWATIFDERVIVDLLDTLGWSPERVAGELTAAALRMFGHPAGPASEHAALERRVAAATPGERPTPS
jgi:AcrR family transcriptional regulator